MQCGFFLFYLVMSLQFVQKYLWNFNQDALEAQTYLYALIPNVTTNSISTVSKEGTSSVALKKTLHRKVPWRWKCKATGLCVAETAKADTCVGISCVSHMWKSFIRAQNRIDDRNQTVSIRKAACTFLWFGPVFIVLFYLLQNILGYL